MSAQKNGYAPTFRFKDCLASLPQIHKGGSIIGMAGDTIFICAAGFEERSTHIPKSLFKSSSLIHALIGHYEINKTENKSNYDALRILGAEANTPIVTVDPYNPSIIKEEIDLLFEQHAKSKKIINFVFDISGACSTFIMSVLSALSNRSIKINLKIIYVNAKVYFPTYEMYQNDAEKLVSQAAEYGTPDSVTEHGIKQPMINELFPGILHESRNNLMIVIPGFRTNRLLRCLQAFGGEQALASPNTSIFWLFSQPTSTENEWRTSYQKKIMSKMLTSVSDDDNNVEIGDFFQQNRTIDMLSYTEVMDEMFDILDGVKFFGKNIQVLNMGTKIQTIGVALTLIARNEASAIYAAPESFNVNQYTNGIGPTYTIDFIDYQNILDILKEIGTRRFQPTQPGKDLSYFP